MSDTNVIVHLTAPTRFGSQKRLAAAAGVTQPTISERKASNTLSHEQMRRILAAAPDMGVIVTPDDFFPERMGAAEAAASQ